MAGFHFKAGSAFKYINTAIFEEFGFFSWIFLGYKRDQILTLPMMTIGDYLIPFPGGASGCFCRETEFFQLQFALIYTVERLNMLISSPK